MTDSPLPEKLQLMDMPFEMFQEFFKHIRNWAMLHQVCNQLRAHIKRAIDTPRRSPWNAHREPAVLRGMLIGNPRPTPSNANGMRSIRMRTYPSHRSHPNSARNSTDNVSPVFP
jgi:hypothetical protein